MNPSHHVSVPLFIVALLIGCGAQERSEVSPFQHYLTEAHARGQFNGVALVYDSGRVVYEGAFGIGSTDPVDSLTIDRIFRLGSVTKQFTAMAIMQLQEAGALRYDQDLRDFIPELPYAGITIRHLLNHTSGVPDFFWPMMEQWKPELKEDDPDRFIQGNKDVIRFLVDKELPVVFAPGERWEYSNTGYNLLATIVERASGMSYPEYMRERVFGPAGMKHTSVYRYIVGPDPAMPDRVFGFRNAWNGQERISTDVHFMNPTYGEGGIYSTVHDLLRWNRALYNGQLVRQATLDVAFAPTILNDGDTIPYGFGWMLDTTPTGKQRVSHSGGWAGFSTYIYRAIDEDRCLVVLTNNSSSYLPQISDGLVDILYGKAPDLPPIAIGEVLGKAVADSGGTYAVARYDQLKATHPDAYRFWEQDLNVLGYALLEAGRTEDAAAILELNAREYPASANVYDSYGDALLAKGDTAGAILNFTKAHELNSAFWMAREKAETLRGKKVR
ncbi:MAG TPA: serine hydrolase [Flavobacteriales bacterium]|nr:serine hydrolase [Flavobacteriales bacterium]